MLATAAKSRVSAKHFTASGLAYLRKRLFRNPIARRHESQGLETFLLGCGVGESFAGAGLDRYTIPWGTLLGERGAIGWTIHCAASVSGSQFRDASELFYWLNESKNANAEVDFVVSQGNLIMPVEVKAHWNRFTCFVDVGIWAKRSVLIFPRLQGRKSERVWRVKWEVIWKVAIFCTPCHYTLSKSCLNF